MLKSDYSKEEREKYKNVAVEIRESGKPEEAAEMFKEVIAWDEENNNNRGKMDALGHLRICYTHIGDKAQNNDEKKEYRQLAMETAEESVEVGKSDSSIPESTIKTAQVHSASARIDYSEFLSKKAATELLKRAQQDIRQAMKDFPGSKAHLSWPALQKAKIEYLLGNDLHAVKTLTEAESWIFEGYDDEIKKDDQAQIKLSVWLSGIHLELSKICANEGKEILAKHYATSVLSLDDPNNMLGSRKKQAQKILDLLN
jgi:hypothetical protein